MVQQMLYIRKSSLGKTHLRVLKHQNTKTSLYKLSKNHWVDVLFEIFGSVRKNYNPQSLMITLYVQADPPSPNFGNAQ